MTIFPVYFRIPTMRLSCHSCKRQAVPPLPPEKIDKYFMCLCHVWKIKNQVISPKILLIESDAGGDLARAAVTIRNGGSTVLFFSWSRVPRGDTIVSTNGDSGGNGSKIGRGGVGGGGINAVVVEGESGGGRPERDSIETKSVAAAAARHAALQEPEGRFFCCQVGIVVAISARSRKSAHIWYCCWGSAAQDRNDAFSFKPRNGSPPWIRPITPPPPSAPPPPPPPPAPSPPPLQLQRSTCLPL